MASSPSGPPSRLAYANPTWGMSRDERWLQDIVSSQRMSLEPTLTLHPRNQRLTEEEMLGGKMFSRSVPSPSSLSARTVSPTGKMDTLCSVVRSGTTQAVYKHLHESCVDINDEERTESGKACTPLSEAIRTRNHCTARLLLDFEADPTQGLSDSPTTTAVSLAAASADSERLLYPKLHGPHTPGFTIFLRTHLPSFRVLRRRSHLDGGPQGELLEERAGEEGGSLLDHHIVDQGYPGNPAPAAGEEACVGNGNLLVSARQEPNETRRGNLSAIPPNSLSLIWSLTSHSVSHRSLSLSLPSWSVRCRRLACPHFHSSLGTYSDLKRFVCSLCCVTGRRPMVAMRMDTPVVPRPSGSRTPTGRSAIGLFSPSTSSRSSAAQPLLGMEIPLYPQPAISSPAVYRLEENGRAFVLYAKDLHRSHAPLRNRGQRAIAPEHPLTRSQSEPQFGPPHFLSHPLGHRQSSSWALRPRARAQEEEPEPPDPLPPVEFSFGASADAAFRRSIPPPPEPEPPREVMPGFAKASSKWSSTPATSHKYDVPLPQLLQDMGYQGASTNKHTQSLVRLFSRHEMAMQVTKAANADIPKEFVIRRQRQPDVPPKQRPKARNRLIMEREEMAMTRKLLMKGQSLTL